MCHSANADLANPNVVSCLDDLGSIPDLMQPIATQYKREMFLANIGYLIRPIQLSLGRRTETRFSSSLGFCSTALVEDTMKSVFDLSRGLGGLNPPSSKPRPPQLSQKKSGWGVEINPPVI
jgi:hypothetical protein